MSIDLSRRGLYVGPSAGLSLVGLHRYLDELRNDKGDVVCVFICPDTPMPYFDEYFNYLDESSFPTVTNENLLLNVPK